jgi:hypothetical protein
MRRLVFVVGVVALALLRPAAASAGNLDFAGLGRGVSGISVNGVATYGNVFAGELNWAWLGAPPSGFESSIYTYCVDLLHTVTDPQTVTVKSTDDLNSPNSTTSAGQKAAWLFNTYASGIHQSGTGAQAAGLQIAIWEALYDTTAGLNSGNVIFGGSGLTAAVITAANTYLVALYSSAPYSTASALWLAPTGTTGQGQITNVAEPATLFLLGLGALVVFLRRRPHAANA